MHVLTLQLLNTIVSFSDGDSISRVITLSPGETIARPAHTRVSILIEEQRRIKADQWLRFKDLSQHFIARPTNNKSLFIQKKFN